MIAAVNRKSAYRVRVESCSLWDQKSICNHTPRPLVAIEKNAVLRHYCFNWAPLFKRRLTPLLLWRFLSILHMEKQYNLNLEKWIPPMYLRVVCCVIFTLFTVSKVKKEMWGTDIYIYHTVKLNKFNILYYKHLLAHCITILSAIWQPPVAWGKCASSPNSRWWRQKVCSS